MGEYTLDQIAWFGKAAIQNWRYDHVQNVAGMAVAIANSLDMAMGSGKGKVLDTYIKTILSPGQEEKIVEGKSKKIEVSDRVMDFFFSMPRRAPKVH